MAPQVSVTVKTPDIYRVMYSWNINIFHRALIRL
jgi:hypothetical protein